MKRDMSSVPQVADSTDVGSSMSDADVSQSTFSSPCCSDNETHISRKGTNEERSGAVLFTPAPQSRNQDYGKSLSLARAGTLLECQFLAQKSRHPMPMPTLVTECTPVSKYSIPPRHQEVALAAPPGLLSPMRRRKSKPSVQSMLDVDVSFSPATSFQRTRISSMEKARRGVDPLKVEPSFAMGLAKVGLDPFMPAKKRLPFFDGESSFNDNLRGLKPGMPLKKRVTAWLLTDPVEVTPR